jgi:hypothetical protein
MAFDKKQLLLVEDKLDSSVWVYDTADTVATVIAAGYITSGDSTCFGMKVGDTVRIRVWSDVTTKASLSSQTSHRVTVVGSSTTALGAADNYPTEIFQASHLSANGADAATVAWVMPWAYRVKKINSVLIGGALATGDFVLTASIGGTGITNGVVTVTQSGSAAFDLDSATPTALNTGAAGDYVKIVGSGTSTGNRFVDVTMEVERIG